MRTGRNNKEKDLELEHARLAYLQKLKEMREKYPPRTAGKNTLGNEKEESKPVVEKPKEEEEEIKVVEEKKPTQKRKITRPKTNIITFGVAPSETKALTSSDSDRQVKEIEQGELQNMQENVTKLLENQENFATLHKKIEDAKLGTDLFGQRVKVEKKPEEKKKLTAHKNKKYQKIDLIISDDDEKKTKDNIITWDDKENDFFNKKKSDRNCLTSCFSSFFAGLLNSNKKKDYGVKGTKEEEQRLVFMEGDKENLTPPPSPPQQRK